MNEGAAGGPGDATGQEQPKTRQRLFVGVPCPEELLPVVNQAQQALAGLRGVRPTNVQQLHVTLAFLGGVEPWAAAEAARVVRECSVEPPGQAMLGDLLPLPSSRRARVIALSVDDGEGVFARLFERVMGSLEAAGVTKREKRPFKPHLTIARLKDPVRVEPRFESVQAVYEVDWVRLYRSELRREGARYTVVEQARLGAA
jgi:RNA 2',3'-cyclic 3'-phosphodiesterase